MRPSPIRDKGGGIRQVDLAPSALRRIDANLGRGSDSITTTFNTNNSANQLNPEKVGIALGTGVEQRVFLDLGVVGSISIRAASATNTHVTVESTIVDTLIVNYGNG